MAYFYEELDDTDKWLAENDPYFKDNKKNKRKNEEYPYETPRQVKFRETREIAFSGLSSKNLFKVASKNVDVGRYLGEKGLCTNE